METELGNKCREALKILFLGCVEYDVTLGRFEVLGLGFPKIRGMHLRGPHDNKDSSILGFVLGPPYFKKLQYVCVYRNLMRIGLPCLCLPAP